MQEPRRLSILSLLCILACCFVLTTVASSLWEKNSRSELSSEVAQINQTATPPTNTAAADHLPPPPPMVCDEEKSLVEDGQTGEGLKTVEAADRIASEVVVPAGPEFFMPSEIAPSKIELSSAIQEEAPRQSVEEFLKISGPQNARQEISQNITGADAIFLPGELAEWTRRFPELVASLPTPSKLKPSKSDEPAASPEPRPIVREKQPKADEAWHEPETLIRSLKQLSERGPAARWAVEVLQQIRTLGPAVAGGSDEAPAILDRLAALNDQAMQSAAALSDRAFAGKWRKVNYALGRRIDIWQKVVRLGTPRTTDDVAPETDPKKLAKCLADVETVLGDSDQGQAWRKFLLIEALKTCADKQPALDENQSRRIAAQSLVRLTETPLAPEQQRFLASARMAALRMELRRWAAKPISVATVLGDIERYEQSGLATDARRLALDCQSLLASPVEAQRDLAERIDMHYRNANFRIAVTELLLNQLIPERDLEYADVNDRVVGRPTRGKSLMATELALRMIPDPHRVRLALEVRGEIASLTTTNAGPAQFHNASESYYVARKPLEITMWGIRLWPVEVDVDNESWLRDVETPLDNIWVLGSLAKGVARSQHDQNKPAATEEVKQKIVAQATERIDAEARQRFSQVVERMNYRVFTPLNSLALDPQLIDAETQEKRLTMRLRLGGEDQLGSHTPRPQAPSDSLASVQIHESLVDNGIGRLRLDGRTFTLPELSRHIAANLNCPTVWATNPENDDVKITFAPQNPVVVRFQDGRVELTLSIVRLSKARRAWKNFKVRAYYRPEVNGRSAELVRDGVIELPDARDSQLALRAIFSRALSKNAPLKLVPEQVVKQPKLQDAAITQFVIEDGWIGLSLGPKQPTASTARRQRAAVR